MKMVWAFVAAMMLVVSQAEARIVESFKVRGWHIDAFVSDQSGKFDSCIGIARYRSGISMSVQVDANYNWWIGFSAPNWTMKPGANIPLRFRIDRGQWQQGTAKAVSKTLARMPMPTGGYIITRFRRGRTLFVYDGANNFQFRLTGTSRLMAGLAKCVERNAAQYGIDLSNNATKPGSTSNARGESGNSGESGDAAAAATAAAAALQVEATQVIFNLMGRLSLTGLNLVPEDQREENLKGLHAVARSDARSMAVHIRTADSYKAERDIMAAMVAEALKSCEGEFTANADERFIDNRQILVGGSSCLAGDVELQEQYAIAKRSKGGALVFAISDTYVGEAGGDGAPKSPKVKLAPGQFENAVAAVSN